MLTTATDDRTELVAAYRKALDEFALLHMARDEDLAHWLGRLSEARCDYQCAVQELVREIHRGGDILTPTHRYTRRGVDLRVIPLVISPPFGRQTYVA